MEINRQKYENSFRERLTACSGEQTEQHMKKGKIFESTLTHFLPVFQFSKQSDRKIEQVVEKGLNSKNYSIRTIIY